MSTGSFDDWQGDMLQIGPLYPFAGTEIYWVIFGFAFWILWHVWQASMESRNYRDDLHVLKSNGNMERALNGEKILHPL